MTKKNKTVSEQEKLELLRLLSMPRDKRPGAKMRYKSWIPYKYDRV